MRFKFTHRAAPSDQELAADIQAHLSEKVEAFIEAGMAPDEARSRALREFGNVQLIQEDSRAEWRWHVWDELTADLHYAFRRIRRDPVFAIAIVLTLALGIGVTTSIFSVANAVLLKPLAIASPETLNLVEWTTNQPISSEVRASGTGYGSYCFSLKAYKDMQRRIHSQPGVVTEMLGYAPVGLSDQNLSLSTEGHSLVTSGELVTGSYFSMLGLIPQAGRLLSQQDIPTSGEHVAVISDRLWRESFGADPSLIGKSIRMNHTAVTIVGVAPARFRGLNQASPADVWLPLRTDAAFPPWSTTPDANLEADGKWWWMPVLVRSRPGATSAQIERELTPLFRQSIVDGVSAPPPAAQLPAISSHPAPGGLTFLRNALSQQIWILLAAAGVVLLLACANTATLLLSRATSRQREFSIRLATGASRGRVVRQLITESLLLSVCGGVLGSITADLAGRSLLSLIAGDTTALDGSLDLRVLLFSLAVSVLTGLLFGAVPAIHAARVPVSRALKDGAQTGSGGLMRNALVVAQIAFSLLLTTSAGLFVKTLVNLNQQDLGFDQNNIVLFSLDGRMDSIPEPRMADFFATVLHRIRQIPGVSAASASSFTLISGWSNDTAISVDGKDWDPGQADGVYWNSVGSDFVSTMRLRLVAGRDISDADLAAHRRVAVVNESFARFFFGTRNPLHQRFNLAEHRRTDGEVEIIGVVRDAKYADMRTKPPRTFYLSFAAAGQEPRPRLSFEVRAEQPPERLVESIRAAVRELSPQLPVMGVMTQDSQIDQMLQQERSFATLCSGFGITALLLAGIGLYANLAFAVTRRTNEIGVRVALGASRASIISLTIREAGWIVLGGLIAGLAATLAVTRWIQSSLYGVAPADIAVLATSFLIIAAVALLATLKPALRASKIDPLRALRHE